MYTVDSNMIGLHAVPIVNLPSRKLARGNMRLALLAAGKTELAPPGSQFALFVLQPLKTVFF